jgi:tetratricopeptide (TPR) repeat protein
VVNRGRTADLLNEAPGPSDASPNNEDELLLDRWNEFLKRHRAVADWLLVLATVVVFRGMLGNTFVYDDGKQILENPYVRNPHLWRHIFTGSVWSFLGAAAETNFYRPLHILSHWIVWQVAGPDPAAFHLYQLVFYVLAVVVVAKLGRELLQNDLAAVAGALLWALHPLHVEPVCWIAGVPDCGCGLFYALAFLIFLRAEQNPGRRWAGHALGGFIYFLALLFKEMAISFPLLLGVYWFVFADQETWWRKGLRSIPYFAAAGCYLELRILVLGHLSHAQHLWNVPPRVAEAALALLGQHAKLFFWPAGLNVFRTFELAPSLHSPWPYLTLAVLAFAVILRKRDRVLCFLVLWWAVTLLPCLDVRQLSFPLLAERFSYLPSMGLCLAVAHLMLQTLPARFPSLRPARVLAPALGLALVLFTAQDLRSVSHWRDNEAMWNYSYRVAPQAALVHVHRALDQQYRYSNMPAAIREYEAATRLNHTAFVELSSVTYDCLIGLGQIAATEGNTDQALAYFHRAVQLTPRFSSGYDALGSVYFPRGNYAQAAEYFQQAVRVNPQDVVARFYLGTCWLKLGKPEPAAEQFHAAREVDPGYIQAYEAEARALEAAGDPAGAARVRSLKPRE